MQVKEIIEAIIEQCGGWKFDKTCDMLIEGDENMEVTGIATTFMATVEVIQQAMDQGINLIITHEPTYYTGDDKRDWVKGDAVYEAKRKLIRDNNIAIWRFHDHMHAAKTDLIYDGLIETLGWEAYVDRSLPYPHVYEIPEMSLKELSDFFKDKLEMDVTQIVGSKDTVCKKVGILVGGGSLGLGTEEMPMQLMNDKNLDVIVCGDITEWTLPPYVRDAAALGMNRALLIIGHERTEEAGMKYLPQWMEERIEGIKVTFIDAKEPFTYL